MMDWKKLQEMSLEELMEELQRRREARKISSEEKRRQTIRRRTSVERDVIGKDIPQEAQELLVKLREARKKWLETGRSLNEYMQLLDERKIDEILKVLEDTQ